MATYNVNVLRKDQTLAARHPLDFGCSRTLWAKIARLAWSAESGGQIKVTDQSGKVVILVGVQSARLTFALV